MAECTKRTYPSEHAARKAMKAAGTTIRPYRCDECHRIHVTKDRQPNDSVRIKRRNRQKRRNL